MKRQRATSSCGPRCPPSSRWSILRIATGSPGRGAGPTSRPHMSDHPPSVRRDTPLTRRGSPRRRRSIDHVEHRTVAIRVPRIHVGRTPIQRRVPDPFRDSRWVGTAHPQPRSRRSRLRPRQTAGSHNESSVRVARPTVCVCWKRTVSSHRAALVIVREPSDPHR